MIRGLFAWWAACAIFLVGCAAPLPRYPWTGADRALQRMNERDGALRTCSATCRLVLMGDEGQVELRAAFVAEPPDHLRVRAWKLSQAVLDVTLNPSGAFLYVSDSASLGTHPVVRVSHRELTEGLALLPGFAEHVDWQVDDDGPTSFTRRRAADHGVGVVACLIEKSTLTTKRCEIRDAQGTIHQSLTFDDYRVVEGIPWPFRLRGVGTKGTFVIHGDDVRLNVDLPPRVFTPPPRAVRQP